MERMIYENEITFSVSAKICDVKQGIRNMGNNPDLFRKHFNKFKENGTEILQQLDNHISQGDFSNASILCHSIKGLSGMLGLTTLHIHMKEAEFFFRDLAQRLVEEPDTPNLAHEETQKITLQLAADIGQVCQTEI